MGVSTAAKNSVISDLIAGAYLSVHTSDPGSTGVNEVAGTGYARLAQNYDSPAGGATDLGSTRAFTIPTGQNVAGWGLWTAVSGGTYLLGNTSTGGSFPGGGVYNLNNAPITVT